MPTALAWAIRLLTVAALAVNAVVHLHLAGQYQLGQSAGVGTGTMFRIAAGFASVAAVLVLVRAARSSYAIAFLVSAGTLAVLVYRYVDVPQLGPIPAMHEPIWFLEKSLSAVAESIGTVSAAIGFLLNDDRRGAGRHRSG